MTESVKNSLIDNPFDSSSSSGISAARSADSIEDAETGYKSFSGEELKTMMGRHRMWSVSGDYYFPCEKTIETVPPGQYIPTVSDQRGPFLIRKTINLDKLVSLPDSKTDSVIQALKFFWTRKESFQKHGFLWKRGILLWGPPGSGKTSCLQQIVLEVIAMGGVSFYCVDPNVTAEVLRIFRRIEPNRPMVVIMEDIDSIVEKFGDHNLLALLDGELQIDNVVFIATTNYPEKLDKRFSKRPSRFDDVVYIGMPNKESRRMFLEKKNPRLIKNPEELDLWVRSTEGFSIAFLKEVIVAVECLGSSLSVTIERLKKMNQINHSSESTPDTPRVGFV